MKIARFFFRTFKGIYDILATYLLIFILPFALAALGIHFGLEAVASLLEFSDANAMWEAAESTIGIAAIWLRLMVSLPAHALLFVCLKRPVKWAQPYAERAFDRVVGVFKRITERLPRLRVAGELVFSLVVTALLIPFVIQPTLVYGYGPQSWAERAANLLDGTATAEIGDSVVGLYRRFYVQPIVGKGVAGADVDAAISEQAEPDSPIVPPIPVGEQPLMDRWNDRIATVSAGDRQKFAMIKAFMYIESAGRQYAVSRTGCAGLMQFCSGTARSKPFKEIFGTGQIYVCGCHKKDCSIPREVQRELESGDPKAIERNAEAFPCELIDARFNPDKIIAAGGTYVENLRRAYGGNIYLMYIGYNSGPAVASRAYRALGKNPEASLEEIDAVLTEAMRPTYGPGSAGRARSLVRTHLPKLKKAYDKYYEAGIPTEPPVSEHASYPEPRQSIAMR